MAFMIVGAIFDALCTEEAPAVPIVGAGDVGFPELIDRV